MAEETIIADEQDVIDESNESESEETVDNGTESNDDVEAIKQELKKERAEREKWESRYKSQMKKSSTKPETKKETKSDVNLSDVVKEEISKFKEQEDFKSKFGEEVYNEVKKVKDKHPTLSLMDAYKISSIAADPASKENPTSASMGGMPNPKVYTDGKTITLAQLTGLDKIQYGIMRDKIRKGEVTLKN